MEDAKISNIQLGMLTLGFLYGSTAIVNPAAGAKRDAWIALLLGWIIGFILLLIYLHIVKMNQGQTLSKILENCFGKFLGKTILVLYILFFLYKSAINTRAFGEFMSIVSYPQTPLIVLIGVFMLASIYVARSGLECMGRISEILVPLIPVSILIVTSSIITAKDFNEFEPILLAIAPIIKSAANIIGTAFGDFVVFLMILPYTNMEKGRFKAAFLAYTVIGVLLMLIVLRNLIVIGPALNEYFTYSSHVAAQLIPGISIDPLIDINLLLGGGIKVAVFLYAASKATAELFEIEGYKPLVCAFAVSVIVFAYWIVPNAVELKRWNGSLGIILITTPFHIVLPVFMFIISFIKRPKQSKSTC